MQADFAADRHDPPPVIITGGKRRIRPGWPVLAASENLAGILGWLALDIAVLISERVAR